MKVLLAVVPILSALLATDAVEVGSAVKDRKGLDVWENAAYIPNPKQPIKTDGTITQWSFYARRGGFIYLQIWRLADRKTGSYRLVGQQRVSILRLGVVTVPATSKISVRSGDLLGFYFPRKSKIPFDGFECTTRRSLYYHKRYFTNPMKNGQTFPFREMNYGWKPCRDYSLTAWVQKKPVYVDLGNAVKNRERLDTWSNAVYIPNPTQPFKTTGVVKEWSLYARRTGIIYMQIWRPVKVNTYRLVGQERVTVSRTGVVTVSAATTIIVRSGDLLGFYFPQSSIIPFDGFLCSSQRGFYHKKSSTTPLRLGVAYQFTVMQSDWRPCRKYSLTARIESNAGK